MSCGRVSVTDLEFQGRFSTRLGADLSFCLPSISAFHIGNHAAVRIMCISCYQPLRPSTDRSMSNWSRQWANQGFGVVGIADQGL
jgi:hypothetical protein